MRKYLVTALMLGTVVFFQYCSSSKKAVKKNTAVTYDNQIRMVIQSTCAPCHIAGKGNKKSLDNYTAASSNVDEIIARIQKNPGERGFMPAMHPKLPDSTIQLFVQWKNSGTLEK